MLTKIYIHYITTLFVLESFIISCWLLKGKKKSVSESESASLLEKNRYRNRPWKIMIGASLPSTHPGALCYMHVYMRKGNEKRPCCLAEVETILIWSLPRKPKHSLLYTDDTMILLQWWFSHAVLEESYNRFGLQKITFSKAQ